MAKWNTLIDSFSEDDDLPDKEQPDEPDEPDGWTDSDWYD